MFRCLLLLRTAIFYNIGTHFDGECSSEATVKISSESNKICLNGAAGQFEKRGSEKKALKVPF